MSTDRPAHAGGSPAAPSRRGALRRTALSWRWWTLALIVAVQLNWLVREAASIYGDETAHIEMAYGLARAWHDAPTLPGALWAAYKGGNGRYPPLGYVLMLGGMAMGTSPLVAARAVSAVCASVGVWVFGAGGARASGRGRVGAITVVLLLGSPLLVGAERYALLEAPLLMWLALLCYAFVAYAQTARLRWWIVASLVVAMGMLTKFNFVMYAWPFLVLAGWIEGRRRKRGQTTRARVLARLALAAAIVAVLAGPWYVASARDPANAGSGLKALIEVGHLEVARTPARFVGMAWWVLRHLFADTQIWIGCCVALCFGAWWIRRRPRPTASDWLVLGAWCGAVSLSVLFSAIGLGTTARWHLQAAPLILAVVLMLDSAAWRPVVPKVGGDPIRRGRFASGVGWLGASALLFPAACQILVNNGLIAASSVPTVSFCEYSGFFGAPDPRPTGSRETARWIDEHFPRGSGSGPGGRVRVSFLVHDHRGYHSKTVGWELERLGRDDVDVAVEAFFDRPIDIDRFLDWDVLVTAPVHLMGADKEATRYQRLEERLPALIGAGFERGTIVRSRYFKAELLAPRGWGADCDRVGRLLDAARGADGRESSRAYYDLLGLVWSCRLGCTPKPDRAAILDAARAARDASLPPTRQAFDAAFLRLKACDEGGWPPRKPVEGAG